MANIDLIIQQIKDEIRVNVHGKGIASISGVARLTGVAQSTLSEAYRNSRSKLAKTLVEHGFDPHSFSDSGVPDLAVALTVSYYANKAGKRCTQEARLVNDALLGVGVRAWMQEVTGWQHPSTRRLTEEEVCQLCIAPSVQKWDERFDKDYYEQLSKLTGLHSNGHLRPQLWGKLTDEWVYRLLPLGVRDEVRRCREENGGLDKLHQFLSKDGLAVFWKHMETLMLLMKAADTVNGVRRSLKNLTASHYQHRLFEDCRKDGQLTISKQLRLEDGRTGF